MIAYNRKHKIAALNQQQLDANFDILYVLINLCIQFGHKHQQEYDASNNDSLAALSDDPAYFPSWDSELALARTRNAY